MMSSSKVMVIIDFRRKSKMATKMAAKRTHGTIIWRPCQDIAYLVNKNESLVKLVLLLLVEKEDGVHMQDFECKLY